jgi:hypothetical protein
MTGFVDLRGLRIPLPPPARMNHTVATHGILSRRTTPVQPRRIASPGWPVGSWDPIAVTRHE